MTHSPFFKIGLTLILLLIVFASVFVLSRTSDVPTTPDGTNTPLPTVGRDDTNTTPPPDQYIGTPLTNRPETINLGGGSYIVAGGNDIEAQPPYQILFYEPDRSYTISLLTQPLGTTRRDAEIAFLELLNISQSDACKLLVMVTVPYDTDPILSGRDLGMSFCATATPLP